MTGNMYMMRYYILYLFKASSMNGPQRTAVSRKEIWQKWKKNKTINITLYVSHVRNTRLVYFPAIGSLMT